MPTSNNDVPGLKELELNLYGKMELYRTLRKIMFCKVKLKSLIHFQFLELKHVMPLLLKYNGIILEFLLHECS